MRIIHANETKTTRWSGGTTTELAILPKGAVYSERNFWWRLSSAVVEDEKSDFTPLPDYDRYLTTRKGNLSLRHNDGEWYELTPGKVTFFDGADKTESVGRVTDYNLMLRKGAFSGSMLARSLEPGQMVLGKDSLSAVFPEWKEDHGTLAIFLSEGESMKVKYAGQESEIRTGELLMLEEEDSTDDLHLQLTGAVTLIGTEIIAE